MITLIVLATVFLTLAGLVFWLTEYLRKYGIGPVTVWVLSHQRHRGEKYPRCAEVVLMNDVPLRCWRRTGHEGPHRYGEVTWNG